MTYVLFYTRSNNNEVQNTISVGGVFWLKVYDRNDRVVNVEMILLFIDFIVLKII